MKSIYLLLILFFLVSYSPAKIKDFDKDKIWWSKIKSMHITTYEYKFMKRILLILVKNTFCIFDSNNNVINEK
jgi:hypothetical protein